MNLRQFARAITPALVGVIATAASAQQVERASVSTSGAEGDSGIIGEPNISADGRYVVFPSWGSTFVDNDTNDWMDVFVRDRFLGTTERVSVDSNGNEGTNSSYDFPDSRPTISADGRFVAFQSDYSNLVQNDTNGATDVFVHDRQTGTTERVDVDSNGVEAEFGGARSAISADGRFIAFLSGSTNLVAGDTNPTGDVFVHDRVTGVTERVSVDSSGAQADNGPIDVAISADGLVVAFADVADNLVANDTNGDLDVFVHDRSAGVTERVNVDSQGVGGAMRSWGPSLSSDGRYVSLWSMASNLVPGDRNNVPDIFVHDRATGTTERVTVDSSGREANSYSDAASISGDGRYVAFYSYASNLVAGDTNGVPDEFVRDRTLGTTKRISVDASGGQANGGCYAPKISTDGRFVVFASDATNFIPNDTNGYADAYVTGPWLTLEAEPLDADAGATLTLSLARGAPSNLVLLVAVAIDGTPIFVPVLADVFDLQGLYTHAATVPSGLSGSAWTLRSYALVPTGKAAASNDVTITFR